MIPPTLQSLLKLIIKDHRRRRSSQDERYHDRRQTKIDSLCHAIVHCARPSMISPLMLALGTLMYRKYGSSELPQILSSLGFCSSYYDTQLLEASIMLCTQQPTYRNLYFQLVFDNADHNTETIDERHFSLHGWN